MDFKKVALDDPRIVEGTVAGKKRKFWLCRRSYRIAKHKHGIDFSDEKDEYAKALMEDPMDRILALMWLASLVFEPDLAFDDFEAKILPPDYAEAMRVVDEIAKKQMSKPEEADTKKAPGKAK